ncbi:MAG: hypothetical protein SGARI_006916 [Bacillariaceae sp.]
MSSSTTTITSIQQDENEDTTICFQTPNCDGSSDNPKTKTVLIVLNTPITPRASPNFERMWHLSRERICADGGANRLHNFNSSYIPDRIRGDLDSLQDDVKAFYASKGVSIEKDPCQDTNDLDKALQVCLDNEDNNDNSASPPPRVIVYGAFGGRFDQEMAMRKRVHG